MRGSSRTFFEPVELHFEAPDFAVQTLGRALIVHWFGAAFALKQGFGLFLDGLLPLTNLYRVDIKFLTNLVDGLAAAQGFERYFGFLLRRVDFAFLRFTHDSGISWMSDHLKFLS
ncbi:MAG: hypothetical protein Fur007_02050 [Rhodoferax sp.]